MPQELHSVSLYLVGQCDLHLLRAHSKMSDCPRPDRIRPYALPVNLRPVCTGRIYG